MKDQDDFTTGQVAHEVAKVAPRTVTGWCDGNPDKQKPSILNYYRLPASQDRRITLTNLVQFLFKHMQHALGNLVVFLLREERINDLRALPGCFKELNWLDGMRTCVDCLREHKRSAEIAALRQILIDIGWTEALPLLLEGDDALIRKRLVVIGQDKRLADLQDLVPDAEWQIHFAHDAWEACLCCVKFSPEYVIVEAAMGSAADYDILDRIRETLPNAHVWAIRTEDGRPNVDERTDLAGVFQEPLDIHDLAKVITEQTLPRLSPTRKDSPVGDGDGAKRVESGKPSGNAVRTKTRASDHGRVPKQLPLPTPVGEETLLSAPAVSQVL